jgi:hypothetical protein
MSKSKFALTRERMESPTEEDNTETALISKRYNSSNSRPGDGENQSIYNMNPSNMNAKMMQHRPSVRSISETPNVIGAQIAERHSRDVCSYILTGITWLLVVVFFPLSCVLIFRVIQEFERGINLIYNFLKLIKLKHYFFLLSCYFSTWSPVEKLSRPRSDHRAAMY